LITKVSSMRDLGGRIRKREKIRGEPAVGIESDYAELHLRVREMGSPCRQPKRVDQVVGARLPRRKIGEVKL